MTTNKQWVFYIIRNNNATYAGVSPEPLRRLRQHNGELSGGAKYTTSVGKGWRHICLVHGFQDKIQAMQFEWAVKHVKPRSVGGVISRLNKLCSILNSERWTSKAPLASTVPLIVEWKELPSITDYQLPNYIKETFSF